MGVRTGMGAYAIIMQCAWLNYASFNQLPAGPRDETSFSDDESRTSSRNSRNSYNTFRDFVRSVAVAFRVIFAMELEIAIIVLIIIWIVINGPLILKKRWRETVKKNHIENQGALTIEVDDHKALKGFDLKGLR